MGFMMERHAKLLGQFIDFLVAHHAATLTIEHALAWAGAPSGADPRWWAARLSVVRGFAVHLQALDPAHQVPPRGLIPASSRRTVVPYLYTDLEIAALVHAAGELSGPLRAVTYQTLIRLLAVTATGTPPSIGVLAAAFGQPGFDAQHRDSAAAPVDVVQAEAGDLAGAQPQPGQQQHDRVVPPPGRGAPVTAGQQPA